MNLSFVPHSHSASRISITADDREDEAPVIDALRELEDIELTIERLKLGDYRVAHRAVFERKTVADFAASLCDGRLFSQAARLASAQEPVALLLEGTAAELAETEIRREAFQGAMISLTLVWQMPVLRALSPVESARLMLYVGQQLHRKASGAVVRHGRKPKRKEKLQLAILQSLPGVGPDRAKALLESFGSVAAVMAAGPEELDKVTGLGKKTIEGISWILHEPAD